MKTQMMVALTVSFISTSGFPITGRDNWQTIKADQTVRIQQPTFAGAFGPQGLFNACYTDEEFRSKTPVPVCLSYHQVIKQGPKGPYKDYDCSDFETRNVTISRTFTQNECVKFTPINEYSSGECAEYDSVTSVYPKSFQLAVFEGRDSGSENFIFSKPYSVPACD